MILPNALLRDHGQLTIASVSEADETTPVKKIALTFLEWTAGTET